MEHKFNSLNTVWNFKHPQLIQALIMGFMIGCARWSKAKSNNLCLDKSRILMLIQNQANLINDTIINCNIRNEWE